MDELAREYHDTHDPGNPRTDLQISRQLGEMEHAGPNVTGLLSGSAIVLLT